MDNLVALPILIPDIRLLPLPKEFMHIKNTVELILNILHKAVVFNMLLNTKNFFKTYIF